MRRFVFFIFLFIANILGAEEAVFELGGNSGWEKLNSSKNISFTGGKFGLPAATLTSENLTLSEVSDLYLSFDAQPVIDEAKNYSVLSSSFLQVDGKKAKYGRGVALCTPQSKTPAVVLEPSNKSFFAGNETLGSFTIEFWIKPEVTDAGSTILRWQTSLNEDGKILYQSIIANLMQNKMEWNFANIWQKNGRGIDLSLKTKSNILPEKWSHHLISYNSANGLLEYRVNGFAEAIEFLTSTRHEGGEVLYSRLGRGKKVEIGKNYSGYLDEFKVSRQSGESYAFNKKLFEKLPIYGGRFESTIIDTGGNYSNAIRLIVDDFKPSQTDVLYYIRASNNQFNWTAENPKWIEVGPNCDLKKIKGRFFQIAAVLFPDGKCEKSPVVNFIKFIYEGDSLPLPPNSVYAKGVDGAVELTWTPSIDFDTAGYMVYYGERSGEYFYGNSPIDVGNVLNFKVEGLENGRLYFFAIVAYDKDGESRVGNFSKEVWARPKASSDCMKRATNN
ncbi:MAG: hypothetical protein P1P64_01995 [Treponemataceae bacterium]